MIHREIYGLAELFRSNKDLALSIAQDSARAYERENDRKIGMAKDASNSEGGEVSGTLRR